MAIKFLILFATVASAYAGLLPAAPVVTKYSAAPAVSYAYQSAPLGPSVAAAPLAVPLAAPVLPKIAPLAAPIAPVAHVAPLAKVAYAAPVAKAVVAEPYAPPHYDFGYSVADPHTGDSKAQQESRQNDVVVGSYSLIDADGFKRTVQYTADDHNGFNAIVHREPLGKVVAAPAPVALAAPVAKIAHY